MINLTKLYLDETKYSEKNDNFSKLDLDDKNDEDSNSYLENKMKALMIEFSSFLLFEKNSNAETLIIIFESMKNFEL
jgi:hypothetical protein